MHSSNTLHNFILADDLVIHPVPLSVKRHELNEAHLDTLIAAELSEIKDLIIIDTAFNHCVDLDARKSCVAGGFNTG